MIGLVLTLCANAQSHFALQFRPAISHHCRSTIDNVPSVFSYDATRDYKPGWVIPVVIISGIVATVLFSFLNLATSG